MSYNNTRGMSKIDTEKIKKQRREGLKEHQIELISVKDKIKKAKNDLKKVEKKQLLSESEFLSSFSKIKSESEKKIRILKFNLNKLIKEIDALVLNSQALEKKVKAQDKKIEIKKTELDVIKENIKTEKKEFSLDYVKLAKDTDDFVILREKLNKDIKSFNKQKELQKVAFDKLVLSQRKKKSILEESFNRLEVERAKLKEERKDISNLQENVLIRTKAIKGLEARELKVKDDILLNEKVKAKNEEFNGVIAQKRNELKVLNINLRKKESNLNKRERKLKEAEANIKGE